MESAAGKGRTVRSAAASFDRPQARDDIRRRHLPFVLIEAANHGPLEALIEPQGLGVVAQDVRQKGKRELGRAAALISPLEAVRRMIR
jgi:hypothetical protein